MYREVSLILAGIGGYGHFYLRHLLEGVEQAGIRFLAAADPRPAGSPFLDQLQDRGVEIFPDLASCLAVHRADLVVIVAPIHFHAELTALSLAHGAHVLCEKPLCATVAESTAMAQAEAQADRFVAVGYQWSFSEAIQALKRDIQAGVLGQPRRFKTCVLWPRGAAYYARNGWAGRIRSQDGRWVLDSPASNATAHYLHNMFYVLGSRRETSAYPAQVEAELYRANPIENYDAAAIRCYTEEGVERLFYAAHSVQRREGPFFQFEFEQAVVRYMDGGTIQATFADGRQKDYGDPFAHDGNKLWQSVDAVRTGEPVACGIAASTPHVYAINGAQLSMPHIVTLPDRLYRQDGDVRWVAGLQEVFQAAYHEACLPAELDSVPWTRSGRPVTLAEIRQRQIPV